MATRSQPLLISGAWRGATGGAFHELRNAHTGEVVTRQAAAAVDDARLAVDAAAAAFPGSSPRRGG